jgi:long-chain-fatty-acid--CoA ligase ACSBG
MTALGKIDYPNIYGPNGRTVSYLPLSHAGGLASDVLAQLHRGSALYFAKPNAMAGTLVETLRWVRPTVFFAVPRIYEKFEEALRKAVANAPAWVLQVGNEKVKARLRNEEPSMLY